MEFWRVSVYFLPVPECRIAVGLPYLLPRNLNLGTLGREETSWWLFPTGLVLCKCIQARLVDWHVSILEIQDRAVYSNDPTIFWQ